MELINVLANITSACDQIPAGVFNLTSLVVMVIQVVVPILLIIWGMVDFVKSVIGGDENKIKEGQKIFIKRLIMALVVFLIVTIVKLAINLVGQLGADSVESSESIWNCVEKFLKGA